MTVAPSSSDSRKGFLELEVGTYRPLLLEKQWVVTGPVHVGALMFRPATFAARAKGGGSPVSSPPSPPGSSLPTG